MNVKPHVAQCRISKRVAVSEKQRAGLIQVKGEILDQVHGQLGETGRIVLCFAADANDIRIIVEDSGVEACLKIVRQIEDVFRSYGKRNKW